MVLAVAGALTAAAILSIAGRRRQMAARTKRRLLSDDCAVDECGPDGLPLNAYSG